MGLLFRQPGALASLGLNASASTVRRVLRNALLELAPTRKRELRWSELLKRHRQAIAAADVEVMSRLGLARYHVLIACATLLDLLENLNECELGIDRKAEPCATGSQKNETK